MDDVLEGIATHRRVVQSARNELAALIREGNRLSSSIQSVELELSNSREEFMATTGRGSDEWYPWRRRAKRSLVYLNRELVQNRTDVEQAREWLMHQQMSLYAQEAGYAGDDPEALLRALYYLTMEALSRAGMDLSLQQVGLITAVRLKIGKEE